MIRKAQIMFYFCVPCWRADMSIVVPNLTDRKFMFEGSVRRISMLLRIYAKTTMIEMPRKNQIMLWFLAPIWRIGLSMHSFPYILLLPPDLALCPALPPSLGALLCTRCLPPLPPSAAASLHCLLPLPPSTVHELRPARLLFKLVMFLFP